MPSATVDLETVAANVRRMRAEKGWQQEQLAGAADVSVRTVGAVELGERQVRLDTYGKLALALEVPLSQLLGED